MQRLGPMLLRICVSVIAVVLLSLPFAGYKWTMFLVQPYNATTRSNPIYVSGPVSDLTRHVAEYTWRFSLGLTEALLGALGGIGAFVVLGRFVGPRHPSETHCRRCRQVLRDLREPKCPACGEPL